MFVNVLIGIIISLRYCHCLSCEEVLNAPEGTAWSVDQLKTMAPKEIVNCLVHISKIPLPQAEAKIIWESIQKNYGGLSGIPDDILMQLRWVITVIEPEEYDHLTLSNIDVIDTFGEYYNLSPEQMSAIAVKIREDWGGKEPADYSYYDLVALKQILCAFNRSEIEGIRPEAYKEAAAVLGNLKNCPVDVLQGLASLATSEKAFGDTSKWTTDILSIVGVIKNGLPAELLKQIQRETK